MRTGSLTRVHMSVFGSFRGLLGPFERTSALDLFCEAVSNFPIGGSRRQGSTHEAKEGEWLSCWWHGRLRRGQCSGTDPSRIWGRQ
jgi:hypothetical protein